jgi:tetratricopeptide (TPR) repeat protein
MSDPLRTDPARALDGAPEPGRDAKIEQLLLLGLDHYFAAEYEQAINVWTRALFLDRNHPRARAYIERARSALSERLRQSEELLHDGVEAFNRGDASEARRLLEAAMLQGAPSDQALALLDRLNRLEPGASPQVPGPAPRSGTGTGLLSVGRRTPGRRTRVIAWSATVLIVVAAAAIFAVPNLEEWRAVLTQPEPQAAPSPPAAERPLPIPRRAETAISRARALAAGGRLHDALLALDTVRTTDPLLPEADRLRADIQQQLLAVNRSRP